MEGQVRRSERYVQEERSVSLDLDEPHRFRRDQVGHVAGLLEPFAVPVPCARVFAALVPVIEGSDAARKRSVGVVAAKLARPPLRQRSQVPFAGDGRGVSGAAQRAGESNRAEGEDQFVHRQGVAEPAPVASREQCRTGGRARGGDVVPVELDAGGRQLIDHGSLDGRPVVAHVGPAHVVGDDEHDIGSLRRPRCADRDRQEQRQCRLRPDQHARTPRAAHAYGIPN